MILGSAGRTGLQWFGLRPEGPEQPVPPSEAPWLPGYELRSQVTVKPLPLPLRHPGWALTAPDESIMVSSSSGKLDMDPDEPEVTLAPLVDQLWKLDSG